MTSRRADRATVMVTAVAPSTRSRAALRNFIVGSLPGTERAAFRMSIWKARLAKLVLQT